ncbi:hypothetical protein LP417_25715 [Polaromonas sp. P1-6]|nr:hypothetical protein LP417_25715 [Polaromonas sp. P1-6]
MQLTVVGAYLPRLSSGRLAAWIADDVKSFIDGLHELQLRGLATSWSEEDIQTRAEELPMELDRDLASAALFEILVQEHQGGFDPFAFSEQTTTAVAWEPAFLNESGEEAICEDISDLLAHRGFRCAFYVHEWPQNGVLFGPTWSACIAAVRGSS